MSLSDEEKKAVDGLRREFAAWGRPIDYLSDEDVIERVQNISRSIAKVGVSARQVSQSFQGLGKALRSKKS